ncbi:MAG: U32 family peptidase [Prevotella sp.]|nr:U32 family peptidase [Prevotella sp.]
MFVARKIELLAPAKNLECGLEAINHGADAVYIGAPQFSARAAAGNTVADIAALADYAHLFGAKVYVALNTILKDEELPAVQLLIWELYHAGIDALIIQDMGITMLDLPPLPLHASTQTDNRSIEKVRFLEQAGFSQIVLARELSLSDIKAISGEVSTPLEVFVHGALCVCYSGQCYLSAAATGRSANRGVCAQYCRLPYTLTDNAGTIIIKNKHLLSMKDLNLSEHLEELLDAGVSSLKIEGRLKDAVYVKNVTAFYRRKLDAILAKHPEYQRASSGECRYFFEPDIYKSFNRGYTEYFFNGRTDDIWSVDSPKSVGEPVGRVKNVFDRFFVLSGTHKLHNGDGLCFINRNGELQGVKVNRVEGENVFFAENDLSTLKKGALMYRNFDHEFEKLLSKKSAERKITVTVRLKELADGFAVEAEDEDGNSAAIALACKKELAQKARNETIRGNLAKTGNTIFVVKTVEISFSQNWFIPASVLSDGRRKLMDKLLENRKKNFRRTEKEWRQTYHSFPEKQISYRGNVLNGQSRRFYEQHQSSVAEAAFEKQAQTAVPLMFARHCIKYSLGGCPKENKHLLHGQEPLYLVHNNFRFRLEFDCKDCEMRVR